MPIKVCSILFGLMLISANASATNSSVSYDPQSKRLSVDVQQMPLKEFLSAVAAQTGIRVDSSINDPHPVTLRMKDVSLESALKSALRGTNYMMKYDTGRDGKPILRGVRVVATGESPTTTTFAGATPVSAAQANGSRAMAEDFKKNDPEHQKQQQVSRILANNLRQKDIPPASRLKVVNRPPTPTRHKDGMPSQKGGKNHTTPQPPHQTSANRTTKSAE